MLRRALPALLALLAGCPAPGDTDTGTDTDPIVPTTWNGGISDVFDRRCVQCHGWATGYATVVEKIEDGVLGPRVSSGHQISGDDQQAVLDWIDDGYPEE